VVVGLAIVEFLARPPTAAASPGTPASA